MRTVGDFILRRGQQRPIVIILAKGTAATNAAIARYTKQGYELASNESQGRKRVQLTFKLPS